MPDIADTYRMLKKEIIENEKICTYFDLPIQHASDKILKSMNRYDTNKIIYNTVEKIRKLSDDAAQWRTIRNGGKQPSSAYCNVS